MKYIKDVLLVFFIVAAILLATNTFSDKKDSVYSPQSSNSANGVSNNSTNSISNSNSREANNNYNSSSNSSDASSSQVESNSPNISNQTTPVVNEEEEKRKKEQEDIDGEIDRAFKMIYSSNDFDYYFYMNTDDLKRILEEKEYDYVDEVIIEVKKTNNIFKKCIDEKLNEIGYSNIHDYYLTYRGIGNDPLLNYRDYFSYFKKYYEDYDYCKEIYDKYDFGKAINYTSGYLWNIENTAYNRQDKTINEDIDIFQDGAGNLYIVPFNYSEEEYSRYIDYEITFWVYGTGRSIRMSETDGFYIDEEGEFIVDYYILEDTLSKIYGKYYSQTYEVDFTSIIEYQNQYVRVTDGKNNYNKYAEIYLY